MNRSLFSALAAATVCFGSLGAQVQINVLQGEMIAPYAQEIGQFCAQIYRAAPYYYNGDDTDYEAYLQSYAQEPDSIVCIASDEGQLVGLAAGMPMSKTRPIYQQPLQAAGLSLEALFYLGEFGLQPEYQGRGLEETMLQEVEQFATHGYYQSLCVWELDGAQVDEKESYVPTASFWSWCDFRLYPELNFNLNWTNIGDSAESPHTAYYWIKSLTPEPLTQAELLSPGESNADANDCQDSATGH